jgi:DNA modification methylase
MLEFDNSFIYDDILIYLTDIPKFDLLFLDPLYNKPTETEHLIARLYKKTKAIICFGYPELLPCYDAWDQIVHWIKPVSTKNTKKKYSRFVEAIGIKHGTFFNQDLHWSTRTGVFTDTFSEPVTYEYQKPRSLVEKLIRLHCPHGGKVLDPFAGTQIVRKVCQDIGYKSLNFDLVNRS